MAKICLSLTAKTIRQNLDVLEKYRKSIDLAELRVDCLEPDERLLIRRFPELAGMPVILTIRRISDGGFFSGGESTRIKLMAQALAYAEVDTRLNFAYVDIEDDLDVPSLEEAARTFGTRIIRSYHNTAGLIPDIRGKIKSMQRTDDEIVKFAVTVNSTDDALQLLRASKLFKTQEKIIIGMGHYGVFSRILAEKFGSFLTYSRATSDDTIPAAPGQLDAGDLAEMYRFRQITKKTKIYGIIGHPLKATVSPWFFNTIFAREGLDSVYVPFPGDSIQDLIELVEELEVRGLSVTVPYKEEVIPFLTNCSEFVKSIGACNTMIQTKKGWIGENTDAIGFTDSLLEFLARKDLRRQKVTIIGAGGVARAVAAEIFRLGGKALILNRTIHKARNIASLYNFRWGGLDTEGIEVMKKFSNVIIQSTSAGMEGIGTTDPLELYTFTGKEAVMDLVYKPEVTPFMERAAIAGCRVINGYNMVIRQACQQYTCFFGKEIPAHLAPKIMFDRR
ncbi:MAG: type I 3-dehydroquinate dehydratase [Treponema sp.]|jgi:3-dehydroquinate dehydratase/shikimate dehydrogenase|nr:type I 3-dehydroquinate dehydratase [Treponema sp.]